MIKYVAVRYFNPIIRAVNVEKETSTSVWINGQVRRKVSSNKAYFDSWEKAKAWLLEWAESNAASARRDLEVANAKLGNVKGMKP